VDPYVFAIGCSFWNSSAKHVAPESMTTMQDVHQLRDRAERWRHLALQIGDERAAAALRAFATMADVEADRLDRRGAPPTAGTSTWHRLTTTLALR
jgi:hypothetical protein